MRLRTLREMVRGQDLLHVSPQTSVQAAAERMAERHVAAVLVIEAGRLKGIFTERDLLQRVVATARDPGKTPIYEVMSKNVVALDAHRKGFEAARLMHEGGIRHVAVTGLGGDRYEIVSIRDFLNSELAEFDHAFEFEHP